MLVSCLLVLALSGCKPKCVKCTSWIKQSPEQTKIWVEFCGSKKEKQEFVHNWTANKFSYEEAICE